MNSFPFDSIVEAMGDDGLPIYDRAYSAEDFRNVMQVFFSNGVFVNSNTALQVTAGEGMTVTVAPGKCLINGATGWEKDARTLEISEASSSDRIDTVVLRFDDNIEERKIDLHVVKGTAGANPKRPNLTRGETVYELGLADIFIPKNTTSISGERITDTRLETERCGVAAPFMKIDTTTFYSQLEAALEKQTAELQEQTDRAVELAQSAINGTTAGNLQQKISKLQNQTMTTVDSFDITKAQDTPKEWANRGNIACLFSYSDYESEDKITAGKILSWAVPYQVDGNGNFALGFGANVVQLLYSSRYGKPTVYFREGYYRVSGEYTDNYWNGTNVSDNYWNEVSEPAPGSITEDMLSSGLRNSIYSKRVLVSLNNAAKASATFEFENPFASSPALVASVVGADPSKWSVSATNITSTKYTLYVEHTTPVTASATVDVIAIAR